MRKERIIAAAALAAVVFLVLAGVFQGTPSLSRNSQSGPTQAVASSEDVAERIVVSTTTADHSLSRFEGRQATLSEEEKEVWSYVLSDDAYKSLAKSRKSGAAELKAFRENCALAADVKEPNSKAFLYVRAIERLAQIRLFAFASDKKSKSSANDLLVLIRMCMMTSKGLELCEKSIAANDLQKPLSKLNYLWLEALGQYLAIEKGEKLPRELWRTNWGSEFSAAEKAMFDNYVGMMTQNRLPLSRRDGEQISRYLLTQ